MIHIPLWSRNYHKIKHLETAGQQLHSCPQEYLHWSQKNNVGFYQEIIQIARLGRVHMLGSWHHCNRLVTSTKTPLGPEIVLFVVSLMCERKSSLGVHESQMPIVVPSPSEPLRCHECQEKKNSQHIWFKKCCVDGKEKKRAGGWNGLGYHQL